MLTSLTTATASGWIPTLSIPMSQFPSRFSNGNFYGGAYTLGPTPSYEDALAFANANPGDFKTQKHSGCGPGKLRADRESLGRLRHEHRRFLQPSSPGGRRSLRKHESHDDSASTTRRDTLSDKASGSYLTVLPSASLRYALTPDTNLRLAYGRGLSRPDPQDIAQSVTFTSTGSPGSLKNTASLGNPNLKAEIGDNFDVLFEHYLKPFGMMSGGVFLQEAERSDRHVQPRSQNFQPTPIAPSGTYTVTQPFNAGSAWITGFEAAYLQHLTLLPGLLGGLGISANYGYTASRAKGLVGRSDHPRLLRNAPNTWNISPTYDRGRVSIRVGLSYNQANIYSYEFQDGSGWFGPNARRTERAVRRPLLLFAPSGRRPGERPPGSWIELRHVRSQSDQRSVRLLSGRPAVHDPARILQAYDCGRLPLVCWALGMKRSRFGPFWQSCWWAQVLGSRLPALRRRQEKLSADPYVVNAAPRSATVMWIVQTGQASIGTEPGKMEKTAPLLRAEKVEFNGLKPGRPITTSHFRAGAERDRSRRRRRTGAVSVRGLRRYTNAA